MGDLFKGRASLLDDLGTRLGPVLGRTDRRAAVTVLTGIGGVGKTRLAVEYAWRQAGDYTAMLLIGADSDAALNTNLAALCGATILDLPERDETDEVRRRDAVVRWLQAHQGWLLILENVDSRSAASTVKTLLPQLLGGHVLITSQLSNWPASITVLPVDLLSPEAATDFLLTRTQGGRRTGSDDRERAHDLAHELGYLPLALEQAGAYIATLSLSFAQYGERWQRQRDAVLAWYDPEQMDYPKSVAITWRTSFEQLGASARQLLRRLAWLAPEPVPESLLEVQVRGADSSGTDPTEVDPLLALAELRSYSLVTRSANVPEFSIHRLVQEISRRDQREDCTQDPLIETLNWVNDAFVGDPHDVRSWSILDPLVPHARTVAGWADEAEIADPTARLLNQLGGLLLDKALYAEAEPLMRRALEIDEMAYGHDDPRVAAHLSNLGQLLAVTNRLPQAELLMRRALLINETSYGPEHPIVAVVLNNLASLLTDTNRLAEAEPLMLRVLAIDMASYGPKHPRIACDLNNLAQLLQVTNRLPEAELLMRRALAIDEENYGLENPEVAVALGNLGLLLRAKNWLTEAEPLFRRALVINEEAYGPEHPTVAIALNNLAVLLQDMKRLDEAYPLIIRALAINEARYGPKHPTVAITLNNLAQLLQATNRFAEAEQLMRRALAIDEASYGPEHSSVVIDLGNLAMLLWAKNRLAEAEPLMRQALSLSVRLQGGENPPPQDIGENYVDLLQAMGKTEDEIHAAFASLFE